MKEVGVCVLFEYYTAACNSTRKNRQKTIGIQQVVALVGLPLAWTLGPASVPTSGLTIGPCIIFRLWQSSGTLNNLLSESLSCSQNQMKGHFKLSIV